MNSSKYTVEVTQQDVNLLDNNGAIAENQDKNLNKKEVIATNPDETRNPSTIFTTPSSTESYNGGKNRKSKKGGRKSKKAKKSLKKRTRKSRRRV
jgi:hypothetical protein